MYLQPAFQLSILSRNPLTEWKKKEGQNVATFYVNFCEFRMALHSRIFNADIKHYATRDFFVIFPKFSIKLVQKFLSAIFTWVSRRERWHHKIHNVNLQFSTESLKLNIIVENTYFLPFRSF